MKKTTLFEKAFKKTLENKKKKQEEDENTVGGGALGPTAAAGYGTTVTGTPGTDEYAHGDYRIAKALGAIQTRNGTLKKKRRKNKKKK